MNCINDFFISHNSTDKEHALALYNVLKNINPEWNIWLDCSDKRPLEVEPEWCDAMHKAAGASKYLIFITSSPEHLKDGCGWVYEEVSYFHSRKATRIKRNAADRTIAYFGIFIGGCDLENELFNDAHKGDTYHILYNSPQHLMLTEDETVEMAAERIKDKVMHLMSKKSSGLAAELLDKVSHFAVEREKQDEMFSRSAICDNLLPPLHGGENINTDFNGLCDILSHSHAAIFSNEGGCGKTTLLTKLFYYYLDNAKLHEDDANMMIPVYIEAKALSAENFLILRYISHTLYGEYTAMTDRFTSDTIKKIGNEFSEENPQPKYLLLIDGYNEIPESSLSVFDKELKDFMPGGRYNNVRLVISSRESGTVFREEAFCELHLQKLSNQTVSEYIKENHAWHGKMDETLFDILKIPMYLKLYVETAANNQIHSKADLLMEFIKWQSRKDAETSTTDRQKAQFHIMLYHILPLIAYHMAMINQSVRSSAVDENELDDIFEACTSLIKETAYRKYFGGEYREILRLSEFNAWDSIDIMDVSLSYFTQTCKLLRKSMDGKFDFIHQVYREFFCALFISEDIKRSVSVRDRCISLEPSEMKYDIKEFVAELLKDGKPHFDTANDRWDYSCNESSCLTALIDISRNTGQKDNPVYISNVIELLKYTRHGNLSGCDFSELDLTRSDIRTCQMYRRDNFGNYATSFAGAKINRENLFCDNHFSSIIAACLNDEWMASADTLGVIKFWSRDRRINVPLKTIVNVRCDIKKLIFSPDGKALYAATPHEILEIPIPDGDFGEANPKVLYETTKILRNIKLSKNNEILFSTVFNPFNYKSISEPQAQDLHNFKSISSCSAVNASGNQVAFGHIAGHTGLKIYNYNEANDEWLEQKVGYSLLLEHYIIEQEEALKRFGLYEVFPHDSDAPLMSNGRSSYFIHLQLQFEDRIHYHEEMPEKVIKRILRQLSVNQIRLNPEQLKELWQIATKYREKLESLHDENPLLLFVSGRKIESIDYREDSDTLLLSCINVFKINNKDSYDSVILELNTRTLETRAITRFGGGCALRAWYSGDGIIVSGEYRISVYDLQGDKIMNVSAISKKVYKVLHPEHSSTIIASSYHFVYEADENGRCINGFNNSLGSYNLVYCTDENGEKYLARSSDIKNTSEDANVKVLKISDGTYRSLPNRFSICKERDGDSTERSAHMYLDKLVFFDNGIRTDEMEICYKLFICGCDFTGVRGTIANPHDLQLLYKYGAKTDFLSQEYDAVESVSDTTKVSDKVFNPEDVEATAMAPYIYRPKTSIVKRNLFNKLKGKDKLIVLKTWNRIYTGFCENQQLEASDSSILEWIGKLSCVTSKMIYELMRAGIVEPSNQYECLPEAVDTRMADYLHRTFKLLNRYVITDGEADEETPIYTLTPFYGERLLRETAGEKPPKTDMSSIVRARELLIRNAWFCMAITRSGGELVRHEFGKVFRTDDHADGVGRIDAYVKLNKQAFFIETFRKSQTLRKKEDIVNKISRLSLMATYFRHLMNDDNAEHLSIQPVLVMICEDYEQCCEVNSIICDIAPHIRKLFTYDTLIDSKTQANHFEFVNHEPFAVKLEELV